jgi:predicted DNA-binding protein (UPF0251 family)
MPCPICDQKPMNCDCTPRERAMWLELQEREDMPEVALTVAEIEAVRWAVSAARNVEHPAEDVLRGLLGRCTTGSE